MREPCSQTSRITSDGRRTRNASVAASASPAPRVSYPSSRRIPSISILMSGSSSTIRMSYAIRHLRRQDQYSDSARTVVSVIERQTSPVVFHDLLDNRQSQSGALGLMCYIGFSQPCTIFLRQPDSVISHDDANIVIGLLDSDGDAARCFAHRNRISRVLQQVGQRLTDQTAIARRVRPARGYFAMPCDLRPCSLLQH